MKLYFKHSHNELPAAQITTSHFSVEHSVMPTYEIHTSFEDALVLMAAAKESYLKVDMTVGGDSQHQDYHQKVVLKMHLRGIVRINP